MIPRRTDPWQLDMRGFGVVCAAGALLCIALGNGGFTNSEAHRAIPGFLMLQSGDWIVPELYGTDYLRKPPGMPWAIAASAAVFGVNEFAARAVSAVSAILLALASAFAARRWFGRSATLPAGLSAAILPWMLAFARSAEIEALNQLGTALAAFAVIDLLVHRRGLVAPAAVGAAGFAVMLLAKGPAGIAVPLACVAASIVVTRRVEARRLAALGASWVLGAAPFLAWTAAAASAASSDAITQSPGAFLFADPPAEIALLPIIAFLSTMPASLALLFPWGPDARAEVHRSEHARRRLLIARSLAWAFLLTVASLALIGVGNPRYALPAAVLAPPAAGYVFWLLRGRATPRRRGIARMMLLGHPARALALLIIIAIAYVGLIERAERAGSARQAGREIAAALPDGATVLADGAIEARPEVLWPAHERGVTVRWIPGLRRRADAAVRGEGVFLLLRDDDRGREMDDRSAVRTAEVLRVEASHFRFVLVRALAEARERPIP